MKNISLIILFLFINSINSLSQEDKHGTLTIRKSTEFYIVTKEIGNQYFDSTIFDTISEKQIVIQGHQIINKASVYFAKNKIYFFDQKLVGRLYRLSKKKRKMDKFLLAMEKKSKKNRLNYTSYPLRVIQNRIEATDVLQTVSPKINYTIDKENGDTVNIQFISGSYQNLQSQTSSKFLYFEIKTLDSVYNFNTTLSTKSVFNSNSNAFEFSIDSLKDVSETLNEYITYKQDIGKYVSSSNISDKKWTIEFNAMNVFNHLFYLTDGENNYAINYQLNGNELISLSDNPLFDKAELKKGKISFKIDKVKYTLSKTKE